MRSCPVFELTLRSRLNGRGHGVQVSLCSSPFSWLIVDDLPTRKSAIEHVKRLRRVGDYVVSLDDPLAVIGAKIAKELAKIPTEIEEAE